MVLSETKLKVNTSKKFLLWPVEGVQTIEVYKTQPAKYMLSVESYNQIGLDCQVLELDHARRRRLTLIS